MTIKFENVYLKNTSVVAGPFLYNGPLKGKFDSVYEDFYDGANTFEDCEIKEIKKSIDILLNKEKKKIKDISLILGADLTNQLTSCNLSVKDNDVPYFGVYNACASFCEELIIGSSMLNNKDIKNVMCVTSGHNLTSERQFRSPVEYGGPKPDYATFTVSAATSILLDKIKGNIKIESGTIGKVVDLGVTDAFDMGSAMTPAAAKTLFDHLKETKRNANYYDLIITGDLGIYGEKIFKEFCKKEYNIELNNYVDSATLVYDMNDDRVLAGGSGPSCLPAYFFTDIVPKMKEKKISKVLLLATGALFSTTTVNQKKSIPCICHAVSLEAI